MAGRRLFSKALAFVAPSSPHLRRHSAAAGTLEIDLLKPATRSESVLSVLELRGVAAVDIASLATSHKLQDAAGDLGSKFDLLRGLGFSVSDVAKILRDSRFLSNVSLASLAKRIDFLKSVVGDDGGVMKMIKKSIWTISASATMEKRIADNIAILKECGLADGKIKSLLVSHTRFFEQKSESILAAAEIAQTQFGAARDANMFFYHLYVWSGQPESTRQAKIKLFKSFGWQISDVHALARAYPVCFAVSAAKLEKGLEFLMNTAGFTPSDIVSRASMLQMSLEGRVSPRYHLIQALKSKRLVDKNLSLYAAVLLSEKDFRRKYVDKFAELEPDACKTYMSRVTLPQKK